MEQIWAPWRAEYLLRQKPAQCIFCLISSQRDTSGSPSTDENNYLLLRDRTCFAVLNTYPYTAGHLMVAPYRHTGEVEEFTEDELKDLMILARRCKKFLNGAFRPDGFNVGLNLGSVAGAGFADHLHLHIVPRWNGDTNFMPVLADVRVVSEGLRQTYDKLVLQVKAEHG